MKYFHLLLVLAFCFSHKVSAQKKTNGFAYLQPSFVVSKKFNHNVAANFGVGFAPDNNIGFGLSSDLFVFEKGQRFAVLRGDIRPFVVGLDKPTSVFVSLQPGYVFYRKTVSTITTKGGFAFDALFGTMARPKNSKGLGVTMSFGYSLLSFATNDVSTRYNTFKISAGIAL